MPNGGTDCCATCWFHSHKLMEMKFGPEMRHQSPTDSFCTIRRIPVEEPHYTYCANHPYRRGEPDPIPIGGVDRGNGLHRWRTHPPLRDPDVRQHLGALLERQARAERGATTHIMHKPAFEHVIGDPIDPDAPKFEYPIGKGLIETLVEHAVEIRALEAVPGLIALSGAWPEGAAGLRRAAQEILDAWSATRRRLDEGPWPVPHPQCYWVLPGVLAGEYPFLHINALRRAHVRLYVDLTTGDEGLEPYEDQLEYPEQHERIAIRDARAPTRDQIRVVDEFVRKAEGVVYVHSYGGVGRTGCIVAGLLMLRGATAPEALGAVESGFRSMAKGRKRPARTSPENARQRAAVLSWEGEL